MRRKKKKRKFPGVSLFTYLKSPLSPWRSQGVVAICALNLDKILQLTVTINYAMPDDQWPMSKEIKKENKKKRKMYI